MQQVWEIQNLSCRTLTLFLAKNVSSVYRELAQNATSYLYLSHKAQASSD